MTRFDPTILHQRAIENLDRVSHAAYPSRSSLVYAASSSFVTGVIAATEVSFKFLLVQPLGMLGKGTLGTVRFFTASKLGQTLYTALPGPSDWIQSAKKLLVLSFSNLGSLLEVLGGLLKSTKAAHAVVNFETKHGLYHKDRILRASLNKTDSVKARADAAEKKAVEEAARRAAERAKAEAIAEANKYPSIEQIQLQAEVAKNEIVRLAKELAKRRDEAKKIESDAKAETDLDKVKLLVEAAPQKQADAEAEMKKIEDEKTKFFSLLVAAQQKQKAAHANKDQVRNVLIRSNEAETHFKKIEAILDEVKNCCKQMKENYDIRWDNLVKDAEKLESSAALVQQAEDCEEIVKDLANEVSVLAIGAGTAYRGIRAFLPVKTAHIQIALTNLRKIERKIKVKIEVANDQKKLHSETQEKIETKIRAKLANPAIFRISSTKIDSYMAQALASLIECQNWITQAELTKV